MSISPSPIQTQQPSDDLLGLHGMLSGLRDRYAAAANSIADKITQRTPNYANMPPSIQNDVRTMVGAGLGAYGVPVPPKGPQDPNQVMESVAAPEPEDLVPGAVVNEGGQKIKIPKGQQKVETIQSNIEQAAKDGKHVYLTYQHPDWDDPQVYKVEPYAYRGNDNQLLAARDSTVKPSAKDQGIRNFKLENVKSAVSAGTTYDPHVDVNSKKPWTVEIGKSSTEDLENAIVKSGQDPAFAEQRAKSLMGAANGAPGFHPSEREVAKELIKNYLAKAKK